MIEPYRKAFSQLQSRLPGLAAERAEAMAQLHLPDGRNEAWRFTSVRKLLAGTHEPVTGTLDLPEGVEGLDGAPVGVVAGIEGLVGLNLGLFREGAVVRSGSVEIGLNTASGLSTPRILVLVAAGDRVEVFLNHAVEGIAVPVIEVVAGAGSTVSITQLVRGSGSFAGHVAIDVGPDARVSVQTVLAGGTISRSELFATLSSGAHLDCSGLVLARDRQHADHHLEIHHAGQGCSSNQVFRNIVDDRARAVFTGAVTVAKNIRGTDAVQSANSLLLSDRASAVARPWLEIHNDQVTAAHGATVGRLDPESLFYLRSRGIPEAGARRLLTRAFAGEVVSTLPEAFRARIDARVTEWLGV